MKLTFSVIIVVHVYILWQHKFWILRKRNHLYIPDAMVIGKKNFIIDIERMVT